MLVSGRNVQNSPLVSLVSEVSVSHQFFIVILGHRNIKYSSSFMLTFLYLMPPYL